MCVAHINVIHFTLRQLKNISNIKHVKEERDYYRKACKDSTKALEELYKHGETMEVPLPGAQVPCRTNNKTIHYSFDMAQQVACV